MGLIGGHVPVGDKYVWNVQRDYFSIGVDNCEDVTR